MSTSDILNKISSSLTEQVHTKIDILKKLHEGLEKEYHFSSLNTFIIDPLTKDVDTTYTTGFNWTIPDSERTWLISTMEKEASKKKTTLSNTIYIENKKKLPFINQSDHEKNIRSFNYECSDGLYFILFSEDSHVLGFTFANNWANKKKIGTKPAIINIAKNVKAFINNISLALDNLFIHQRIENLLSDKKVLTQRIKQDEEDLKRRILELTALYDTSNALGYTLNDHQIASVVTDALAKVLEFDVCSIFLWEFIPESEIITRINTPLTDQSIHTIHTNVLTAITPFLRQTIDTEKIKISLEKRYATRTTATPLNQMKSFANVPLIFKEEVIGILNICSSTQNAFPRNEMTFLHTMANQLASNLGRLKIIKKLEESKISSLIESMNDGVIMFNEHHQLTIVNPAAEKVLELSPNKAPTLDLVFSKLKKMGLLDLYNTTSDSKTPSLNNQTTLNGRSYSVNISLVSSPESGKMGTVMVFRDITEQQKTERIKTQRLDVIAKVNDIIGSITDLNNLLTVLMEFILSIANAEMGSILLKEDKVFFSKVHSNFPDKIRRFYKFKTGITISDYVIQSKKICHIEHYFENTKVLTNTKILIDTYLCIPLMMKNKLFGVINIVRKYGNTAPKITAEDIKTLTTITTLCATAIQNAIMYQKTLSKEKLDQELLVATHIQKRLLPEKTPNVDKVEFGALSVPARQIGGDYYDFFELDNGNIGIIVADIVGKGIPAGLLMATLKGILYTNIRTFNTPSEAMFAINNVLVADPVIDKFVPALYAILNPTTLEFNFCNAGHEPALIFKGGKFEELNTEGFPLGGFQDTLYEEKAILLTHDDFIFMFTDGIIEARNKRGISYGETRFKKMIKENCTLPADEITREIYNKIDNFSGQNRHDDLTLVTLKINDKKIGNSTDPIKVKKIKISSAKSDIKKIRQEIDMICKDISFSKSDIFDIKLAINEAQANIIEHAYFGSEEGDIHFQFSVYKDKLIISIRDFGAGIGQKTVRGEKKHLQDLEGSGLGVFLIKEIMDDVKYSQLASGTELTLTKYIKKGE
jgi:phosphoserine phosphatase RsbU/P